MIRFLFCMLLLAGCLDSAAFAQATLYQDLGGEAGVSQIVKGAVALYLSDDRIKDDFDNINIDRLTRRLTEHVCQITNGPCVYHGRSMKASHEGLDLTRAKFNAVAEDFQASMQRAGIPYRTQNRLMALLAPMQRDIVTR